MNGIAALQNYGLSSMWQQARYMFNVSAARAAAANPARAETPVEPVQPVRALPADVPVKLPLSLSYAETRLPTEEDLNNASEVLARMRIQYPEQEGQEAAAAPYLQELGLGNVGGQLGWQPGESDGANAEGLGIQGVNSSESPAEVMNEAKCETCEKRKYQDGSDDPGVSYKTPTTISADNAAAAVRGHEQEHVVRERAKAEQEDRKVVSQSVTLHTDICPECGRVYISGGTTRTVTMGDNSDPSMELRNAKKNQERSAGVLFGEVA